MDVDSEQFGTANSGANLDLIEDVDPNLKTRLNVILVGTKLDLVKQNPSKRQVKFAQALKLANEYSLAGAMEVTSLTVDDPSKTFDSMSDIE